MLKVTVNKQELTETWELEGKLSGEWVKELERCWRERPSRTGIPVQVNLKAVSYVDADGKQLLAAMHEQGAEIKGCGCMARAVVEEIIQFAKRLRAPTKKILAVTAILFGIYAVGGSANLVAGEKSHCPPAAKVSTAQANVAR